MFSFCVQFGGQFDPWKRWTVNYWPDYDIKFIRGNLDEISQSGPWETQKIGEECHSHGSSVGRALAFYNAGGPKFDPKPDQASFSFSVTHWCLTSHHYLSTFLMYDFIDTWLVFSWHSDLLHHPRTNPLERSERNLTEVKNTILLHYILL